MIPIAKPYLGEEEAAAAREAILSGWVTQGPRVAAFEQAFADYVEAPHACAVSSCTTALHLALLAVGVKPGDEVVTVSHSYIATANAIRYAGAIPVFVDIDPKTFNIDPTLIEPAVSDKTRAILCVHQMGMPCDLNALLTISKKHNLPLIEDAACAIGSEINMGGKWEKIGRPHGDIACFSFHPRKVITTGDGGMLTTSNPEYDQQFRLLRQHAMSVPDTVRHGSKKVVFESYPELGYNYRMTDIQAAMGIEQMKKLPGIVEQRLELAAAYREQLADVPGITLPAEPDYCRSNWQSFCVRLDEKIGQFEVMQQLLDQGIASRRGIMCAHCEPAYASEDGEPSRSCGTLLHSEGSQENCIVLPLFPGMTPDELNAVSSALQASLLSQGS